MPQVTFPGLGQMTAAGQLIHAAGLGGGRARRRSKRRASASRPRKARREASSRGSRTRKAAARLVKGSKAAKAWGRKMRAMRKRRA